MQALRNLSWNDCGTAEDARLEAMTKCSDLLQEESFCVSWISGPLLKGGVKPPDIMAIKGYHAVRIIVLLESDIDEMETKLRIRAALEQGETRVCVPWPLRWRALSNLDSWGLHGVAVMGW